ncbi:MAG: sugar ABC transporter permease [Caldilineaceae bacterium]
MINSLPMRNRWTKRTWRSLILGLLFISPWLVNMGWLILYPFFASMYYSLTYYNVFQAPNFIGLENYRMLFTEDKLFWISLYNTAYFTVFAIGGGTVLAIIIAMMLNMSVQFRPLYRTIYYLPTVTPAVANAVLWLWLFNPLYGPINAVLKMVGLSAPGWLGDPAWAKPALILMSFWGLGQAIIIYLASLQDVPRELMEASELDGANWFQRTANITLPLISPVIFFNVVTGLIGSFQYFTEAYVMTQGGPGDATLFYGLYLYNSAFRYFKMGYASALAWILFLVILVITLLTFRVSRRHVHYMGG